jgi:outer membrane scaffolding protein for murein synthesis (MipA/OmpV family)
MVPRFHEPLAFALTLACATASAQSEFYRSALPPGTASGGVAGAAVIVGQAYPGATESRTRVLPSVAYQWANGWFAGLPNGVGYNASTRPDMAYGVRLTADFGREEKRSPVLQGLGDVEARPQVGAFFNASPLRGLNLLSSLRYGSGHGRDGLLVDVGAATGWPVGAGWRVGAQLAATWANAAHQQAYFGVDAAQAARSGLPVYEPDAGLQNVRASASVGYSLTPEWSVSAALTHTEWQGDARRSPVVRDAGSTSGLFTVGRRF